MEIHYMNDNISKSFTRLEKSVAIEMATKTILRIQDYRKECFQKKVRALMKEDQRSFWQRLFKYPPIYLSEEDAIKELKTKDSVFGTSEYDWCNFVCSNQETIAKKVLSLTKYSTDEHVYITAEDIWALQ